MCKASTETLMLTVMGAFVVLVSHQTAHLTQLQRFIKIRYLPSTSSANSTIQYIQFYDSRETTNELGEFYPYIFFLVTVLGVRAVKSDSYVHFGCKNVSRSTHLLRLEKIKHHGYQ